MYKFITYFMSDGSYWVSIKITRISFIFHYFCVLVSFQLLLWLFIRYKLHLFLFYTNNRDDWNEGFFICFPELQPAREKPVDESDVKVEEEPVILRETSRVWTPIDNFNREYEYKLACKEKGPPKVNYIKENKVFHNTFLIFYSQSKSYIWEVQNPVWHFYHEFDNFFVLNVFFNNST